MKRKLWIHLITLPRWFAIPIAVCSIILGGVLMKAEVIPLVLAALSGALMMAAAHSSNTLIDYSVTGFDKGTEEERSKPKEYTVGQSVIAAGILSEQEVLGNIVFWLVLSAIPAGILSIMVSPWVWLFWALAMACSPLYSLGKRHYLCELVLGLGFGPIACCLGASSASNPHYLLAFLAGIPIFILWGFGAETMDQYTDAEPNWPRGLRNLGALVWHSRTSISVVISWLLAITFISQLFLIAAGVLKPLTALTLITFIPFTLCLILLQRKIYRKPESESAVAHLSGEQGSATDRFLTSLANITPEEDPKAGIIWGLGGIYLYCLLLLIGQVL